MKTPFEIFSIFFTEYLLEDIVTQTNVHAVRWEWVGNILLAMGIVEKKGRIADYWTKHWPIQTPGFSSTMTSNRFLSIIRYLHFVNNRDANTDKNKKMWKVQPVIMYLIRRFPRHQIDIDETMIQFKGRLKIKQYIQNKPTKWGIK